MQTDRKRKKGEHKLSQVFIASSTSACMQACQNVKRWRLPVASLSSTRWCQPIVS